MYIRKLKINEENHDSVFLWGARQVGKTTWLTSKFPASRYYDLLRAAEFERLLRHPELLAEELADFGTGDTVIIDEIQKLPQLLDEVHYLIQRQGIRFILSGSSARKLRRAGTNLLGGRASKVQMFPLVSAEIPDFDLLHAINNGMIPRHYMVKNPWERMCGYIGVYLNEEVREEAFSRNLKAFSHFLEVAARSNGEMLVYKNIAQDCGIDYRTVKEYFSILEDTLLCYLIPGFTSSTKRRAISAPKFYFFDVGIVNYLMNRRLLTPGTDDFGRAFEHLMIQEIIAFLGYSHSDERLTYWRTASGYEVDAIVGDGRVAIEFKSSTEIQSRHTHGLKAFQEEHPNTRPIIVSLDKYKRRLNGIEVMPATEFLKELCSGKIL